MVSTTVHVLVTPKPHLQPQPLFQAWSHMCTCLLDVCPVMAPQVQHTLGVPRLLLFRAPCLRMALPPTLSPAKTPSGSFVTPPSSSPPSLCHISFWNLSFPSQYSPLVQATFLPDPTTNRKARLPINPYQLISSCLSNSVHTPH